MTEQNKYSTTPRDYSHVGAMPQTIATGKYLGKVDPTSQLLARDIRNFAWAEDTQESIARFIEWCSILYSFTEERNDHVDFSVGQMNTMFSDVIKELSEDKDYHSLPEIAGARRGYQTLIESLNNLSFNMFNTNLGKVTPNMVSDELLAQIAGDAAVNAVPADGSLTTEKFASKSVTLDKMEVIPAPGIRRINLFNKEKYTPDSVIGSTTGIVSPNPTPEYPFAVSDLISIEPNQDYYKTTSDTWVIFDKENNLLDGGHGQVIPGHPNGAYVRFVFQETVKDTVMFVKGNTAPAEYEPYGVKFDVDSLDDKSIPESKLADNFLKLTSGKNLFNKDAVVTGKYPNYANGNLSTESSFSASEFIPIEPNKDYIKSDSQQLTFYDSSKIFISGLPSAQTFTTPENAHFLRLAISNTKLSTYQLEEGTVLTEYEEYGQYIPMESFEPTLVESLKSNSEFKFILPDEIYTVTDEEYSIYFRNILSNNLNLENYDIVIKEVDGANYKQIGRHIDYKWFYTPTAEGQKTLEIRLIDSFTPGVKALKRFTLITSNKTLSSVSSPNIITIGDSFTDGWGVTKNIHEMMTTDTNNQPNFLGLHDSGVTGVKDDAWSGYSYAWYYGVAEGYKRADRTDGTETSTPNQFYNPTTSKFDFSYYMSTYQSDTNIDIVQCLLGINDSLLKPYEQLTGDSLNSLLDKIEEMWDSILAYDNTIKILPILITPLNGLNDGFITGYSGLWNGAKISMRKVELFNLGMLERFGTQAWRDKGVHLVAVNAHWDYRYAIRSETIKPVKFDQTIEEIHTMDIHPNLEIGSKYIADSMRNAVRYFQA